MFIQTEETPNPATVKFLPGQAVMGKGVAEFKTEEEGQKSPLASALFALNGVAYVFYGSDFISVTKDESQDWDLLKPQILAAIMQHYTTGLPLFEGSFEAEKTDSDLDDAITAQIKELLETRVRPMVAQDGGDIIFHSFENGIVYLQMRGACAGCPSSTATLKSGVENMLRHYVPEVKEVCAVE